MSRTKLCSGIDPSQWKAASPLALRRSALWRFADEALFNREFSKFNSDLRLITSRIVLPGRLRRLREQYRFALDFIDRKVRSMYLSSHIKGHKNHLKKHVQEMRWLRNKSYEVRRMFRTERR